MKVNKMVKKHEIQFRTSTGEFSISTDDINDLFAQSAILDILGIRRQPVRHAQADQNKDSREDVYLLRAELDQIKARVAQSMQTPQAPAQAPIQAQAQRQEGLKQHPSQTTFLDITPDQMKADVWRMLVPNQQEEWLRKYNMTR